MAEGLEPLSRPIHALLFFIAFPAFCGARFRRVVGGWGFFPPPPPPPPFFSDQALVFAWDFLLVPDFRLFLLRWRLPKILFFFPAVLSHEPASLLFFDALVFVCSVSFQYKLPPSSSIPLPNGPYAAFFFNASPGLAFFTSLPGYSHGYISPFFSRFFADLRLGVEVLFLVPLFPLFG